MRELLHKRNYLPKSKFYMINWDAVELALTPKPVLFSLWAKTFVSSFCATSKFRHQCKLKEDPTCPCYKQEGLIKDTYHVLGCPAPQTRKLFDEGLKKLVWWIESTSIEAIAKGFSHCLAIGHTPTTDTCPILILEGGRTGSAFQAQGESGRQHTV